MKINNQNIITFKIEYECNDSILEILKQYNNVLRFTYNRLFEDNTLKTKEITLLQKTLKNCNLIKSHLRNSVIYDAKALIEKNKEKQIIFGGQYLFKQRCKHKIGKEDFQIKKLRPLISIGESIQSGNRLFEIINNKEILFKLDKQHHFTLNLKNVGRKREKELLQLKKLQDNKTIAITYKLDLSYIYLSFDFNKLKTYNYKIKENRVFAIDMNPNSIGWSVVDWLGENKYNVIQSGTFSLKSLNDYRNSLHISSEDKIHKYITNKRKHEIIEITKQLFSLTKYYHCEIFSIEQLNIKLKDNKIGKNFNKLVNNMWNRDLLIQQIKKLINASSTTLVEVQPQYNSYIGNLVFRKECLPDECLASIEIGRRGYEFYNQYIFKRRPCKKNVIFPDLELVKKQLFQSLEELEVVVPNDKDWKYILSKVKESKTKYRFSSAYAQFVHKAGLFSKFYKRRYCMIYTYL